MFKKATGWYCVFESMEIVFMGVDHALEGLEKFSQFQQVFQGVGQGVRVQGLVAWG